MGDDKRDFSISSAGVLTFKTPPDYENPADSNGDNVYRVTIHASNGTSTGALLDVAINITKPNTPATDAPATGAPTISGTAQVGETLTASTSGISDADGLTNATFSYQWVSNDGSSDTDISGATSSTYTLVAADEGKTIKVKVSFTDDAGNEETLTGSITVAVVPLTASFEDMPDTHDGSAFTFEVHFSEEISISYVNMRDDVLNVSGGTVTKARRLNRPSNMSWEITVEPSSNGDVSIALSSTTDCNAASAVCTSGGKALSSSLSATVTGPQADTSSPLTASFKNMPTTHDGSRFTFELHFSEEIAISYVNVRDDVLEVSGGTVKRARRLNRPSNMSWEITVKPSSNANVSIALSPTTDCEADECRLHQGRQSPVEQSVGDGDRCSVQTGGLRAGRELSQSLQHRNPDRLYPTRGRAGGIGHL